MLTTKAELVAALAQYPDDILLFDGWDEKPLAITYEPEETTPGSLGIVYPARIFFYGRKPDSCEICGNHIEDGRMTHKRIDKPLHCLVCAASAGTMEFETPSTA